MMLMNMKMEKVDAAVKIPGVSGKLVRPVVYTAVLVVVALIIIQVSSFLIPHLHPPPPGTSDFPGVPQDVGNYFLLRTVVSVINVALIIYLIFIYVKDYLSLKSGFTLGLVAFLFSFLLYALSTFPLMYLGFEAVTRNAFMSFVPMLFSLIGLLIFLKLSQE